MTEDKEIEDRWDAAWNEACYWSADNSEYDKSNHEVHIILQKAFLHGVMWQEDREKNNINK